MNFKKLLNKNVKIITPEGDEFTGNVHLYFYPDENENGKESIVLESCPSSDLIEFYEEDIKEIIFL